LTRGFVSDATPDSTLREYDKRALRLTNSAIYAKPALSEAALAGAERIRRPPIEAACRAGNVCNRGSNSGLRVDAIPAFQQGQF
jgi:hypothetical protein